MLQRFLKLFRKEYKADDIRDCIKMYFDIVADMTSCTCKIEIKTYFIDIDIFKERFKHIVPDDLFYTYLDRLQNIWHQESRRVEQGRKPLYIR